MPRGVGIGFFPTVSVPGQLPVSLDVGAHARVGDVEGYVELRRGADVRRVPIWGRVTASALARHRTRAISRPGLYRGTTRGQPGYVSRYRYPETPRGLGVTTTLRGPELVYRLRIARRVANFGVVVTRRGAGSHVEPRVVSGLDEDRLTGYAGLPVNHNPYTNQFDDGLLAAGALSPAPGDYAVVFDSASRAGAGSFTFRYWVNDVRPPVLRLRSTHGGITVSATDAGSGVDPASIVATLDGRHVAAGFAAGTIHVAAAHGQHRLVLEVADYQETKNMEDVPPILPNTATLRVTVNVR
jgi:hypothetical protein